MNGFLKLLFGLLASVLLSGCVSQHQQLVHFPSQDKPIEDPEKGRIYVMRQPWLWNIASHMALVTVRDGDLVIGSIAGHRGFLCWEREPGQARVSCIGDNGGVIVAVEKGKVYYMLQHVEPVWQTINPALPGSGEMATRLELVNEEKGRKELSKCVPPTHTK